MNASLEINACNTEFINFEDNSLSHSDRVLRRRTLECELS